jgi:hypothetical protein
VTAPGHGEEFVTARAVAVLLGLALPATALGAAWDVEARTEAQFYSTPRLTSVPGEYQWLRRQRLAQVLDLAGFELVGGEDAGMSLVLRLDADFGVTRAEEQGLDDDARARLLLLGARLWWKGLARGRVDVEVGRVNALDPVTFFAFDGGRVAVRPVRWLEIAAFGGLRVEGASWLGSSTFAPDGVRDSDARRLAAWPAVACPPLPPPAPGQPERPCADPTLDDPAPVFGGRMTVTGLPGGFMSSAHAEYRRTLRAGGVIEERIGGALRYQVGPVAADAAAQWDLYLARLAVLRASLRWAALPWLVLAAEGGSWRPVFSADSIFNVYDTSPWQEARLRADLSPGGPLRLWAAGGLGWIEPTAFGRATFGDRGGTAPEASGGASWATGLTALSADASWRGGVQGRQLVAAARARRVFRGWLGVDLRAALVSVDDPLVAAHGGTFLSGAAQLSGRLERRAQVALLGEVSQGRFGRADVRLQALLDLGVDWDTRLR